MKAKAKLRRPRRNQNSHEVDLSRLRAIRRNSSSDLDDDQNIQRRVRKRQEEMKEKDGQDEMN